MSVRIALFTYLAQVPALTTLLGTGAEFRVYPHTAPQGVKPPYLVVRRLATRRPYSLREVGQLRQSTFQFEGWGKSMASVDAVMGALEDALHEFSGSWDDVEVKRAVQNGPDFDDDDPPIDASQVCDFSTIQQWDLTYQKAA